MTLLLFDIDGTLVRINGTGRRAIERSLSSLTERPISTEEISFSGRTDPDIFEAILAKNDLAPTKAAIATAIDSYVETMQGALTTADVELLPGVRSLLSHLHTHPTVQLGLVTGNVEPIALKKLSVHDLAQYFPVGAFGSDHRDRNQLPDLATRRASAHAGVSFRPETQAIVIGDTPHDIECARAVGARVMAVCTGRHGRNELSSHAPDFLHDTLPTADSFLKQLGIER